MTHQEFWVRGSHDKGLGLVFERRTESRMSPVFSSCSWLWLRLGCHLEKVAQYDVPMERKPRGVECVIYISKVVFCWCWQWGRAPRGLCCLGNAQIAVPSLGITQDKSSSVSPGERWPGPVGALFNPEPALPKLQRAPAYSVC